MIPIKSHRTILLRINIDTNAFNLIIHKPACQDPEQFAATHIVQAQDLRFIIIVYHFDESL